MKKSFLFLNSFNRQCNMLALFVATMLCMASVTATPSDEVYLIRSDYGFDVITTCSGTVQDPGGDGDYSSNDTGGTLYIYPETPGDLVQLTFTELALGYSAFVLISDVYTFNPIASFNGCPSVPTIITAPNGSGLFVQFGSFGFYDSDCGFGGLPPPFPVYWAKTTKPTSYLLMKQN